MRRVRRLAPLVAAALLGTAGWGCGSEQSQLEHGDVVGEEEAVPGSPQEYRESAAERQQQEVEEEQRESDAEFEKAQQQAP